ncbi:MAG TPA: serine/threonine-protein kinase [Candidatus Obscuribacterales bacterium]
MKKDRVVISAHNATMRTAFRLVALTAPFWALYVPGIFLGAFGFFIDPLYFAANERIFWMLFSFGMGTSLTALLSLNTLILQNNKIIFPPLKSASFDIHRLRRVHWFFDPLEREAYLRFTLHSGDPIDIHHLRLSPKKIAVLQEALKRWAPQCEMEVKPEDLEDLVAFRERFTRPQQMSLISSTTAPAVGFIEIPYHPHEQLRKFFQSLGANEKYFWWCWSTVLLLPCIAMMPDIIWGLISHTEGWQRYWSAPPLLRTLDSIRDYFWVTFLGGTTILGGLYVQAATHPFVICILLGMAALAVTSLGMFIFQPNRILLKKEGLEISFRWKKLILFRALHRWEKIVEFKLDQFGDEINPEKWRLQIKMADGDTVNLKLLAIKGEESKAALLRTISELAPEAAQDPALVRALTPPQKESYTELWLQSLAAPPKRNRLAPLAAEQKLKDGRYCVSRQLAVGGQGTAYLAEDLRSAGSLAAKSGPHHVVLKEFVLPVYTAREVRKRALERFENEAKILGNLDHPRIVKLVDYFLEDHRAYLALEHIDGLSLRQLVREEGPIGEARVREIAHQMCDILKYLHSQSPPVVHRDFTPDNLILDKKGKLVLIDFNVAQQRQWTATSTVVGKHAYLPPEQFRGQPTPESDLYAMGATMFFLLTGQDPEPLTSSHPAAICESVSSSLDRIVSTLTEIEVEDRFSSPHEVRQALLSKEENKPANVINIKTRAQKKHTVQAHAKE